MTQRHMLNNDSFICTLVKYLKPKAVVLQPSFRIAPTVSSSQKFSHSTIKCSSCWVGNSIVLPLSVLQTLHTVNLMSYLKPSPDPDMFFASLGCKRNLRIFLPISVDHMEIFDSVMLTFLSFLLTFNNLITTSPCLGFIEIWFIPAHHLPSSLSLMKAHYFQ